jgi:hypothetical protein
MDDGCNDRDFDPSPEAAALIRARLADGHRGLQQLLIDALGYRQAGNGLQREELAALIDERVAREQLGGWYLAALAAQDRAAKAAEDLLEHGCLDDVAHERVATRLSELHAVEAAAERAVEQPEFPAADTPGADVHPDSLAEPIEYVLEILDHTSEPAARDRILTS